jgi:hypothetical protein
MGPSLPERKPSVRTDTLPTMTTTSAIPARLSIVTIGARDVSVLRRFYLALGRAEQPISDDGVRRRRGRCDGGG